MAGVELVASSRPVYDSVAQTLAYAVPELAAKGDLLLLLALHDPAAAEAPLAAPWVAIAPPASGGIGAVSVYAKLVDDQEPGTVTLTSADNPKEWQGQLLVLRGASPGTLVEASASQAFTTDATPDSPAISAQQSLDQVLLVLFANNAVTLAPPAGFVTIDTYTSAVVGVRTCLFALRQAGASGALTLGSSTASGTVTGRSFAFVLRDRPPMVPRELVDLVPGSIGLVGKDTRPPRETGAPGGAS